MSGSADVECIKEFVNCAREHVVKHAALRDDNCESVSPSWRAPR